MTQGAYYTTGIGAAFGAIVDGTTTVTTSGTAVRITVTSTPIAGVWVAGDIGNTDTVVVGASTVVGNATAQRGIALEPAGNSIFIPINNLNLLYCDADTNGDKVIWCYLIPATD